MSPQLVFTSADWLTLFMHFASLSLLGVGGAITTSADMHRFLVDKQGWLADAQFNSSIALAQAAPGPNILFVALMGWNVGLNTGSTWAALSPIPASTHITRRIQKGVAGVTRIREHMVTAQNDTPMM